MSNFKNWTAEKVAEFQQKQLARRMDAIIVKHEHHRTDYKPAKKQQTLEDFVIPKSMTMGIAHADGGPFTNQQVKRGKAVEMVGRPKNANPQPTPRAHIGTTFVGVDPALRQGGFWVCIICRVDNTATFKSCKNLGEFVRILQDCEPAAVIVENSNLQQAVFDKKAGVAIGVSVGKNMGVSQAAADIADQYSEIPSGISPKQKGAKVTNDVVFRGIVQANGLTLHGYKGAIKAAQDQRDCFMLGLIAEQQYKMFLKTRK